MAQQQRRLGALQGHLSPSIAVSAAVSASASGHASPPPLRVAVTGTSVGIGLEFVRQYAASGARVFALCRSPSAATELAEVAAASNGRVTVHSFDQTDADSVAALSEELSGVPLDVMINNAAVGGSGPTRADYSEEGQMFGSIDYEAWADTMDTNVFGVLRATEAIVPSLLLSDNPKLVMLSSAAGHQQGRVGSPGFFVYRSSKAAMNMVNRLLDAELAPLGVAMVVLHPGTVQTRMNKTGILASESVEGMRGRIHEMRSDMCEFMMFDGTRIQW